MSGEWTFTAAVTNPDGVRTQTTISVPLDQQWFDVIEVTELAQMNAARAMQDVTRTKAQALRRYAEEAEEVPF